MIKQDYHNYKRYYAPHHFIFLPAMAFFTGLGTVNYFKQPEYKLSWALFALLSFSLLYLAIMLRQHYALGNQNRIVRLEFRLRHLELVGSSAAPVEQKLSFAQIAALRFADDAEFKILLARAINEGMDAETIKKSISNWQADHMRV